MTMTGFAHILKGIVERLDAPVSIVPLAMFRIIFGAVMAAKALWYFTSGQVEALYIDQAIHFPYPGFSWIGPLPGDWMRLPFLAVAAFGLMVMFGYRYRLASAGAFVAFTYVFLIDQSYYQNHDYLLALLALLMAFLPAAGAFSIDARRRAGVRTDRIPRWQIDLLRFQFAAVYFFAGIAKLDPDWLSGAVMRIGVLSRADASPIGLMLRHDQAPLFLTYGGLLFDLLVVPALAWRRTRVLAIIASLIFHLTNALTYGLDVFPWLMMGATVTLLIPSSWVARGYRAIIGPRREGVAETRPPGRTPRAAAICASAYVLAQLLLPLRHLAYPGSVAWTEEGHRYAWRMMVRSKAGTVRFVAEDPVTGRIKTIDTVKQLNPTQRMKMSTRPEMIRYLAGFLADEMAVDGRRPRIFADALVSLNGRPFRRLIEPSVDLASTKPGWGHADWIAPFDPKADPPPLVPHWSVTSR